MASRPLRIAVTGSAGTGKTTLAAALARRLGLPLIEEETRAYIESTGRAISALPPAEAGGVLAALWETRRRAEDDAAAFVADNCALDFAAQGLHHGCAASVGPSLLEAAAARMSRYDAVVLLPWGAIPYRRDGVRGDDPCVELRYQLVLEALLGRHLDPARLHRVPDACNTPEAREAWIVARLPRRGGGIVHLVGAGPGHPGLLTVRAAELLRIAEVVAYDELVPRALLELPSPAAELLPVGRRCHGPARDFARIHPIVIERARAGRRVVRLKAGDPFVFGRGGEEAEALAEAGIAFEVVPGISAALGAAASALIPLTHRATSSDVTFATAHELSGSGGRSAWPRLATTGTLVLYMGARSLAANLARLIELGRPTGTPAAWIASATRPEEKVVVGTLADLAGRVAAESHDGPALVIVGEVVAFRERLLALSREVAA